MRVLRPYEGATHHPDRVVCVLDFERDQLIPSPRQPILITNMTMSREIDDWLAAFSLEASIHSHIRDVVSAIPPAVRADFMDDHRFAIADYEPGTGQVVQVPLGNPTFNKASRSVVLKRSLRRNNPAFVRYVIAHELAHAYLRNGGRSPGEDPEHAADALAAEWGFPRIAWS